MTKEEAKSILQKVVNWKHDHLRGHPGIEYIAEAVEILLSDSSLPSNLDEAAQKVEDYYDVGEEHGYLYCHRGDIKDAFKAGAEWMAGQGVTIRKKIGKIDDGVNQIPTYCNGFEITELDVPFLNSKECGYGNEVIVQIRNKQ